TRVCWSGGGTSGRCGIKLGQRLTPCGSVLGRHDGFAAHLAGNETTRFDFGVAGRHANAVAPAPFPKRIRLALVAVLLAHLSSLYWAQQSTMNAAGHLRRMAIRRVHQQLSGELFGSTPARRSQQIERCTLGVVLIVQKALYFCVNDASFFIRLMSRGFCF